MWYLGSPLPLGGTVKISDIYGIFLKNPSFGSVKDVRSHKNWVDLRRTFFRKKWFTPRVVKATNGRGLHMESANSQLITIIRK